ncbi:MAG TPA: helix-turn-helix domain-containing protein [Armatimonadota bacterium]|jgi:AcrR family transcriptional regulator
MAVVLSDNPIAQRILNAGMQLFAAKGYAATTTREIVEAAGVTKPMLYYYFQSKEGLCRSAIQLYLAEVKKRVEGIFAQPMEPVDRVVEILWFHLSLFAEEPAVCRLGSSLMYDPSAEIPAREIRTAAATVRAYLLRSATELRQAGQLRPGSEATLARVLGGLLRIWSDDVLQGNGEEPTHQLVELAVHEVLDGFRVRPMEAA